MSEEVKYSSVLFIVAAVLISSIVLLFVVDFYGSSFVIKNFCTEAGFRYEERVFNDVVRGYCVFEGLDCVNTTTSISECLAVDFFTGECYPCSNPVFNCSRFEGLEFCFQDFNPVCARVRVGRVEPFTIIEETAGNACTACFNSKPTRLVTSYVNGSCAR